MIFFFSCQRKETQKNTVTTSDSEPVIEKSSKINNEENKQVGDTIFMNYKNEKGVFTAEGSLDSIQSRVYVKFKTEDIGELNGKITPSTGTGNIRFNQIIFPDKNSDGPFGIDLKVKLQQKGNYILVIGHSQMADNPFLGKFKVDLEIKNKQ